METQSSNRAGSLIAMSKDGDVKWRYTAASDFADFDSPPVVSGHGRIYAADMGGSLHALTTSGKRLWVFRTPGAGLAFNKPVVSDSGVVYFPSEDFNFYAVGPSGKKLWAWPIPAVEDTTTVGVSVSATVGDKGIVYVGASQGDGAGTLYALSPRGSVLWKLRTSVVGAPVVSVGWDGTAYVLKAPGTIAALGSNGSLVKWTFATSGELTSPIVIDGAGTILFSTVPREVSIESPTSFLPGGSMYALRPDGKIRWKIRLPGGVPEIAGLPASGVVYVVLKHYRRATLVRLEAR